MKKQLVLSITIILLLAIIISGSTFAYFSTVVKGNGNDVLADSAEFGVIYNKGNPLTGDIEPTISKDDGLNTSVNIKLSKALSGVTGDILLNVTNISDNLKINGFKWESYKVEGNTETLLKSGNFADATNGGIVSLVDNLPLSTTLATIKVYIWLDATDPSTGNDVVDGTASFNGYISAKSNRLTGILDRYTVTLDAQGGTMPNLLYGLDDIGETNTSGMKYSISNGVVTVTAKQNDGSGYTTGRVNLEAGKTYVFNCNTDGVWGGQYVNNGDSVEAFLMLNGKYPGTFYGMSSTNNNNEFTPTVSGTYWLRLDVNKEGETYQFWNISITEKSKQVTYGQSYGTLPTPTREGYTFKGWNGKNLINIYDNANTLNGVTVNAVNETVHVSGTNTKTDINYGILNLHSQLPLLSNGKTYTLSVWPNINNNIAYVSLNYKSTSGIEKSFIYQVDKNYRFKSRSVPDDFDYLNKIFIGIYQISQSADDQFNIQLEEGTEATEWEPYYITSNTTVVQNKNHTLKAIWEPTS